MRDRRGADKTGIDARRGRQAFAAGIARPPRSRRPPPLLIARRPTGSPTSPRRCTPACAALFRGPLRCRPVPSVVRPVTRPRSLGTGCVVETYPAGAFWRRAAVRRYKATRRRGVVGHIVTQLGTTFDLGAHELMCLDSDHALDAVVAGLSAAAAAAGRRPCPRMRTSPSPAPRVGSLSPRARSATRWACWTDGRPPDCHDGSCRARFRPHPAAAHRRIAAALRRCRAAARLLRGRQPARAGRARGVRRAP